MTKQRLAILSCLARYPGHYTTAEIYALAKEEYPGLSRATVYNALPTLTAEGKLKKIMTDGNTAIYDTTVCDHPHAVCPVCGSWEDVFLPDIGRAVEAAFGEPVCYSLTIHRLCEKCKNQK